MNKKKILTNKNPKLIETSKFFTTMLYVIVFIACIPLSILVNIYIPFIFFPLTWLFSLIHNNFNPYYLYFGSGDDSMLQIFFFFISAWYLFAIFYFSVQFIAKYIGKDEIDIKLKLKNFLLNSVSFTIFYIILCSKNVSKTILEGIRIIICDITSIDFCNYKIYLFSFPDEKILYLLLIVWFFIVAFCIYLLYKIYLLKRKINEEKTKRKYYYLTFLMMFALIPLYLYISIFPFGKKTIEEVKQLSNEELINYVDKTRIFNDEVDKIVYSFNYCKVDEDCEAFIGVYPFDCNQVVNKEKVEISKTIMNNIIKKYNWSGPQYCSTTLPNVSCENNKCVFINEEEIGFVNF